VLPTRFRRNVLVVRIELRYWVAPKTVVHHLLTRNVKENHIWEQSSSICFKTHNVGLLMFLTLLETSHPVSSHLPTTASPLYFVLHSIHQNVRLGLRRPRGRGRSPPPRLCRPRLRRRRRRDRAKRPPRPLRQHLLLHLRLLHHGDRHRTSPRKRSPRWSSRSSL
jgi:hypothetical protein